LTAPSDITAEATSAAGAAVTFAAHATDAVSTPTLTYSQASGTTFALGTTTVTVTAKDAAGNTTTGTFTVIVQAASTCKDGDDEGHDGHHEDGKSGRDGHDQHGDEGCGTGRLQGRRRRHARPR
jgi:hypothetical protein